MIKKKFTGLSEDEVRRSREKHGANTLEKEKRKGFFRKFIENLNDPIIKILIIALSVEVIFTFKNCNYFEIFGILAAILIATTVATISEYGSELAFEKMQMEEDSSFARVLRGGGQVLIPACELVVGDIVYISAGEKINADGFILDGCIKVDQSALNGESKDVTKRFMIGSDKYELTCESAVFRGSVILSGEAVMRVGRVGASTYYGMVAKDVQGQTRVSPLKLRLGKFASDISKIGYLMAFIVAMAYLFNTIVSDNGFVISDIRSSLTDLRFLASTFSHALTLMITVIVVAAPEGLPMMITVVLSANMKRMTRDGVLVKKLVGIETAGSMNILFTDKTGTLTTGKIELERISLPGASYKTIGALKKNDRLYHLLTLSAKYNCDSVISSGEIIGGNATDKALIGFFADVGAEDVGVIEKKPFSSETKCSSVSFNNGLSLIKGAPEIIISRCSYMLNNDGSECAIDRSAIYNEYMSAAKEGNRVVAVSAKFSGMSEETLLCLLILKDKIRRDVRRSVRGVIDAGVQVVMLTGDSKETATAIAVECGIIRGSQNEIVLTSSELQSMTDDEVRSVLPNLRVLARALPQDKLRLVKLSQELDLVVGMTGDGINDAPSLKLADVGFAMGNGADIAKSAGDVILVDNSFYSINRTILYGRTIFKSIRKFITFQLIMNLAACGVSLVGQFIGIDSPITIIQMLWVNIIMDTLGGLAFAGEPSLEYYMKEVPKRRNEPILSRAMLHQIAYTGAYTLLLCVVFLTSDRIKSAFRGESQHICAFYALFIFAGIFNCFGARCERVNLLSNISKNKPFVFIMLFISTIQIAMIYCGGSIFRTTPLSFAELSTAILIAASVIPFEIIRRIFYKLRKRRINEVFLSYGSALEPQSIRELR